MNSNQAYMHRYNPVGRQVAARLRSQQQGAAILLVTIFTLLVGTLGVLMIGRVGMQEQTVAGIDMRSKEVYSAAIGGLEYSTDWIEDDTNLQSLVWTDNDGDTILCEGDTSTPTAMANTALTADTYVHTLTYTLNNCINERPLFITASSQATALNDTHVTKTVSVDLVIGEESLFSNTFMGSDPYNFSGPPLLLENCTSSITGNPDAYANGGIAIGTTMGTTDTSCLANGHLTLHDITGTGKVKLDPSMPLSEAVFGIPDDPADINDGEWAVEQMLMAMQAEDPSRVFVVNGSYPFDSSVQPSVSPQLHTDLGLGPDNTPDTADDEPVIFYVASMSLCLAQQALDGSINCSFSNCPKINGNTDVVGLVYYADESCTSQGFGGGDIYGTIAKKGDVTKLNSNTEIHGRDIDFTATTGEGDTSIIISVTGVVGYSEMPGTWQDF